MKLTKVDEEVLAELPRGEWFDEYVLPHRFKNRRWRLERLEEAGLLKSDVRFKGGQPGMGGPTRQWRVKEEML